MTTDGEEPGQLSKRRMVQEAQQLASQELLDELRAEREDLVAKFDGETDLKSKMIIEGVQKVCVLS